MDTNSHTSSTAVAAGTASVPSFSQASWVVNIWNRGPVAVLQCKMLYLHIAIQYEQDKYIE